MTFVLQVHKILLLGLFRNGIYRVLLSQHVCLKIVSILIKILVDGIHLQLPTCMKCLMVVESSINPLMHGMFPMLPI